MALSSFSTSARNAIADALVDLIDVGSTDAGGDLQIRTAGGTTLLAEPTFSNPAFGAASSGVATANSITADSSAAATGTAAVLRIVDRDNVAVVDGTVSTSGEDLNLNTTSIATGDNVSITSATITAPS